MIELTRINGEKFILNADLIQEIQATPDTVITLINQKNVLVRENIEEIRDRVIIYKKKINLNPAAGVR